MFVMQLIPVGLAYFLSNAKGTKKIAYKSQKEAKKLVYFCRKTYFRTQF